MGSHWFEPQPHGDQVPVIDLSIADARCPLPTRPKRVLTSQSCLASRHFSSSRHAWQREACRCAPQARKQTLGRTCPRVCVSLKEKVPGKKRDKEALIKASIKSHRAAVDANPIWQVSKKRFQRQRERERDRDRDKDGYKLKRRAILQ